MSPSATARFSLSATEFKECLCYFGHRWTWKRNGEVRFVVRYRYFSNRFSFVVNALIFFLHYVYTTLPSEGQDYIVHQMEREILM